MNLKQTIIGTIGSNKEGVEIYLFGSFIKTDTFHDIDIAIIYDRNKLTLDDAVNIRTIVRAKIAELTKHKTDILLLSQEENLQTQFFQNIKTEKVI